MTITLFTAMYELAQILGNVVTSTSTGAGSTATLVDSTRSEVADYWNEGILFIQGGTYASSSRRITDFASGTFTFTPVLAGASGNGSAYSAIDGAWPRDKLIQFINRALRDIGDVPKTDTSLTTVARQESYTLPAGMLDVRRVEVAQYDTAPYYYLPYHGVWEVREGKLYFKSRYEPGWDGRIIRITYAGAHTALSADSDTVNAAIHLDRLIWRAAAHAWLWRVQMSKQDEPTYQTSLVFSQGQAALMERKYPISWPIKSPILSL